MGTALSLVRIIKKLCIPFSNCCDWISVLHKMKVMCMFLTKQAPAN